MGNYKKLKVWQKSHRIALKCHRAIKDIHGGEYIALRSQIMRAAFSVPSNIVEGNKTNSALQYASHIRTSRASNDELEYHITCARDLPVMSEARAEHLLKRIDEVGRMLSGLLKYLEERAKEEKRAKDERAKEEKRRKKENP